MLEEESNQPMEWYQDDLIALIAAYEKRPILWNDASRTKMKEREEALLEVASELKRPPKLCRKKWDSLGSTFRKERVLMRRGNTSNWWAFSHMRFLLKKGQACNKMDKNNILKPCDNKQEVESEDKNEAFQDPKIEIEEPTVNNLINSKSEDEDGVFGELVAKKLRQYDNYTKTAIQSAVLKVFLDANRGIFGNVQLDPF